LHERGNWKTRWECFLHLWAFVGEDTMAVIYEKNGAFHLRAYSNVNIATGLPLTQLGQDGKPLRKQQTVILHRRDDKHTSERSTPVLLLANAKVAQIEKWEEAAKAKASEDDRPTGDMTVADFYETKFLPYIKREKAHSTVVFYEGFWGTYLKDHFNHSKTLANYESYMATNFLEKLGETYSKNTVTHIRALGSAIFAYAVAKGFLSINPWFHARKNISCVKTDETYAYDEKEIENILTALGDDSTEEKYYAKSARMLIATCFYGGLRPSEAVALKWENVQLDAVTRSGNDSLIGTLHVCEAYVNGKFKDETKTGESRTVAMQPELLEHFKSWAALWHHPTDGLVFPNQEGDKPIDIHNMVARFIKPTLVKAKINWHGLYACRRGFGTILFNHGATVEQIAAAMGNSVEVAFRNYVKDKTKTGAKGIAAWANAKKQSDAVAAGR
jgi:integrase